MSKKSIHFKSDLLTRWQWPLKIGLPPGAGQLKNKLLAKHWPKEFTTVESIPLDKKTRHYNILLIEKSIGSAGFGSSAQCTSDILIILKKNAQAYGTELGIKTLALLGDQFKCKGIFIVSIDNVTLSEWFYDFTVHLSHNENVVQALNNTTSDGFFFYDKKLETETTLSHIIKILIEGLRNRKDQRSKFNINTSLTVQKTFTAKQLADLLELNSDSFVYVSESGDASDLNEISKPIFEEMSDELFQTTLESGLLIQKYKTLEFDDILGDHRPPKISREIEREDWVKKSRSPKPDKKYAKKSRTGGESSGRRYPIEVKSIDAPIKEIETAPIIKVVEEQVDDSRYLQAKISTGKDKTVNNHLKPNSEYKLEVRIGVKDDTFLDAGQQFDSTEVFKASRQKKEPIQIKFKSNLDDKVQFTIIILPRNGNSTLANFHFKTNSSLKTFEGDIFAYHKNRLIQQVQLKASITKNVADKTSKNTIKMKVIFCTRKNLTDIKDRAEFTASVEYKKGAKKSSSLSGIAKNKPVDLYFSDGLKGHLADMKKAIEDALININKHTAKLTAKGNQELLFLLALKGNLIYTNHLRGAIAPEGPLQIITNYQEYVPLDFVYSLPAPTPEATLCKNAAIALQEGACKNCFDRSKDPSPHICPFGFWAFSRVVERHSYQRRKNNTQSDYSLVSEPTTARNTLKVLQNSIYGSSQRVETTQTKGIRKEIATGIKKNVSSLFEANDWKNWTALVVKHNPDSLILIVHIEKDSKLNIDKIEIGKEFVLQNYFGPVITNKNVKPPPFIIIIGCEATNLNTGGFDVSSHFMNEGAAIVLSNFTKIRGRQAKDIVIKLVDFLKKNGKKEILFGEVLLKLRQYLLSQGLMAGLSLVAQGDADWKIKT